MNETFDTFFLSDYCFLTENMLVKGAAASAPYLKNLEVRIMEVGTVISLAAALIALIALILNSRKETRSDAAALAIKARIDTSLSTLNSGVTDIRVDLRTMRDSITDHSERLARVEARAESNTHRLEVLEGK